LDTKIVTKTEKQIKMKKFLIVLIISILFCVTSFAETKTFIKEGQSVVQKDQSVNQVIDYLKQKLTRQAQDEAGMFITSELNIENKTITKDEFTRFAGSIATTTVLEETPFMIGTEQYVKVKIKADIDTDTIKPYLEKIINDKTYEEQAKKAIKEAENLRKKNLDLEKKLENATKKEYEQKLSAQVEKQLEDQKKRELEIERLTLQAKQEIDKLKQEQIQNEIQRQKDLNEIKKQQELSVIESKKKLAQEEQKLKKKELENQTKIKDLERQAAINIKTWNTDKNKKYLQDVEREIKKIKKDFENITRDFENLLIINSEDLVAGYQNQISILENVVFGETYPVRDRWETTNQYNNKLAIYNHKKKAFEVKYKTKKNSIVQKRNIELYTAQKNTLSSLITTLQPFIIKLTNFQHKPFYDTKKHNVQVLSIASVNPEKQYFTMKINFDDSKYSLDYNFADIGIDKAKLMEKTLNQFVIEPFFSIDNEYTICNDFIKNISVDKFNKKYNTFFVNFEYANNEYRKIFYFSNIEQAKQIYEKLKKIKQMPDKYKKVICKQVYVLKGFNVKHLGTKTEKIIRINKSIKANKFNEWYKYEFYRQKLQNILKTQKYDKTLNEIIKYNNEANFIFDLKDLKSVDITDKE
jgi:hypothetical protein